MGDITFVPIDFSKYKNSFSKELMQKFMSGEYLSNEDMRKLMYGYSYSEDSITDDESVFDLEYWDSLAYYDNFSLDNAFNVVPYVKNLIMTTILSTGDGLTPQTAFAVIHVEQEYQFLKYLGISRRFFKKQKLILVDNKHIDCLELDPANPRKLTCLYFDVSQIFETQYR